MKVQMAMNNANVYGVANHVDFVVGDFFSLAPSLKVIVSIIFFIYAIKDFFWFPSNFVVVLIYILDKTHFILSREMYRFFLHHGEDQIIAKSRVSRWICFSQETGKHFLPNDMLILVLNSYEKYIHF